MVRDFGSHKFGTNCFVLFVGDDDWVWEGIVELCGSFFISFQHFLIAFGGCLNHGSYVVTNVSGILDLSVCFDFLFGR